MSSACIQDTCDSEKDILDLVKFLDVHIIYDLKSDIQVEFLADPLVKGSSNDWIGIFEAGWKEFGSFLAFESVFGVRCDDTGRRRRVKFPPKSICRGVKEQTHYQFVYVDKDFRILGVSQYFQFKLNSQDSWINEESFVVRSSSSPLKKASTEDKQLQISIGTTSLQHSSNCKLYSPTKWENLCTSCYHCKGIFQLKASHNDLITKVKEYEEINETLQERIDNLEKSLELERSKEEQDFKAYIWKISQTILHHEEGKSGMTGSYFDWDFNRKELYLKAVIGHQELTIQELKKVICKLGFLDNSPLTLSYEPKALEDIVKKVIIEERDIPEVCEVNSYASEDEIC